MGFRFRVFYFGEEEISEQIAEAVGESFFKKIGLTK
jgi:hypothetical protein